MSMVFMVIGVVAILLYVVMSGGSSTQCRLDALDSMCKTYGYATGGAKDVIAGSGNFTVICDNAIGEQALNFTGWLNVSA